MVVLFAKVAGKRMSLYIPLRHNREDHGTARRDLQSWANLLNFTYVRSSLLRAKKNAMRRRSCCPFAAVRIACVRVWFACLLSLAFPPIAPCPKVRDRAFP